MKGISALLYRERISSAWVSSKSSSLGRRSDTPVVSVESTPYSRYVAEERHRSLLRRLDSYESSRRGKTGENSAWLEKFKKEMASGRSRIASISV
jgi:hypothetical protein